MANAKPRVHEIASELGVDSKVALAKLKELGEFVKSPSSTIEPPVARKLRAALEADGAAHPVAESKPVATATARPAGRPGPVRPAAPAAPSAPAAATVEAAPAASAPAPAPAPAATAAAPAPAPAAAATPASAPAAPAAEAPSSAGAAPAPAAPGAAPAAAAPWWRASGQQPLRVGAGHGPASCRTPSRATTPSRRRRAWASARARRRATSRVRRRPVPAPRVPALLAHVPVARVVPAVPVGPVLRSSSVPAAPVVLAVPVAPAASSALVAPPVLHGSRRLRRSSRWRWRSWPWSRRWHRWCLRQGRRQVQAAQVASGEASRVRDAGCAGRRWRQRLARQRRDHPHAPRRVDLGLRRQDRDDHRLHRAARHARHDPLQPGRDGHGHRVPR